MLALADRDGIVHCTIPGLADRARISLEQCEYALARFQQPDRYSWSKEAEGRRIKVVDEGWYIINHAKFRELMSIEETREKTRLRVQRYRERNRKPLQNVTSVTSNASNDIATASATTTAKATTTPPTPPSQIPENMPALNYARKILEDLPLPITQTNMRTVAAAIESEVKNGKSAGDAYLFVWEGVSQAKIEGIRIDKFFFEDGKYRLENRRNGNGKQHETFAERDIRNMREAGARVLARRYGHTENGGSPKSHPDGGKDSVVARRPRQLPSGSD